MPERFETPYDRYDVLAKWHSPSWNAQTREVVAKRLREVPGRQFLNEREWKTLEAVCSRLIPQPDRAGAEVPIVPFIDQKLKNEQGDGYRYEDMPDLRTAWRRGIEGIEKAAQQHHQAAFASLEPEQQDGVLRAIQNEEVHGDPWDELPPRRFFNDALLKTVVGVYYAHPAAWSETGFGGPASPRGYVRREIGRHDSWEADERWNPVSGEGEAG